MKIGVVLGSGLGAFADTLDNRTETPYSALPGWPQSTAVGHAGKLVEGRVGLAAVVVLAGRAHFYEGYSANFFDGLHYVMKGGSPRTEACMLRGSFRNWFQPHYEYVYAGFRCVTR